MKRCPKCNRTYKTDTQKFCTHDGGILVAVESPHADTIRIDSSQLDAPTKAISRELIDPGKFDPYKTTIGQPPPKREETAEPRGRITQDLTPLAPPPPPPEVSAPLVPPDSGTLPQLPPTPTQPPQGSASTQFPTAAQAQQVKPLTAAPPKKKPKVVLILGILAVLLVLGVGVLAVGYILVVRPRLAARRVLIPTESPRQQIPTEPTPMVATSPTNTESPTAPLQNEPPPYNPPADAVQFVNSNKTLDGKLAEHYLEFNFYYPERWEKDPKAGVPGASNFVKVERRLPPDFTQENFAVGWYSSSGSATDDKALFPTLTENLSSQFAKSFPEYRKVSEGETKAGVYDGYEFRFESNSRNTAKGDLKIWGRVIFLPPTDGGKNGVTLVLITTSLAPEVKSIDDVGVKGELPMILESFRFGKKT